jgi:adenylate kinase family enzyme
VSVTGGGQPIGTRVLVVGFAGAGKSTFSRALAGRTGLPLIHLDLQYWKPGWKDPSEDEWREKQRHLLAGDAWILDGNYIETLDLRLERAHTIVLLDTPWWRCAARAFVRGIRRPAGTQMPEGCEDSVVQRLRDEWRIAGAALCDRGREADEVRAIASKHGQPPTLYVVRSKRDAADLLGAAC